MPFLLDKLEDLEKCADECKRSQEKVLDHLTESQRVEFDRLVAFFVATKSWYERVLHRSFEENRKLSKQGTINLVLGFLVLGVVWFFFGSDSFELKLVGIIFVISVAWREFESKSLNREISSEIRAIQRDLDTTNVHLTMTYKIIQKERQLREFWEQHEGREISELTRRKIAEKEILRYYWQDQILRQVTKQSTDIPLVAFGILD